MLGCHDGADDLWYQIKFVGTKLSYNISAIFVSKISETEQNHSLTWYNGDRDGADDLEGSDRVCGDKVVFEYFLDILSNISETEKFTTLLYAMVLMT